MRLYDYYRSSCSYRVRIALNWKALCFEKVNIDLLKAEHHAANYQKLNPQGLVPALEDQAQYITQSLAILEYLEETYPTPALLPQAPYDRAQVRGIALMIACDIHPLNNLRVLNTLRKDWQADATHITQWYHHWLREGFDAIEKKLSEHPRNQPFCYADQVTLADICLIPQVYNALRYEFSLDPYPIIRTINQHCLSLPAFEKAQP
jgi:maleylacetoacetate isomerase